MKSFKKIDYDFYTKIIEGNGDISNYLVDRVNFFRGCDLGDYSCRYDEALIDCESPIEQLLSVELYRIGLTNLIMYNPKIDVLAIEKQVQIESTNYRVDFFIPVLYYKNNEKKSINFIIECDGHEFHQKTKQQVEKDNERTRTLQNLGYQIIRFSGTEIYHKPYKCACEILNMIVSKSSEV